MRPLRVAYLLLHFPYLTETFVAQEVKAIRELGVDAQIISLLAADTRPAQRISQGLLPFTTYAPSLMAPTLWLAQLYYLGAAGGKYLSLLWRLLRCPYPSKPLSLSAKRVAIFLKAVAVAYQLRDSEVDLIHTHFAWLSGAAAWICAALLQKPFTVTTHAYDIYATDDLLRLVAGEACHVVTISEFNRQYIADIGARAKDAITIIRCGVDLDEIAASADDATPAAGAEPIKIISVGSLNLKKGHRYLIEACHLLKERGAQFVCTIIGGGDDEAALRSLVTLYGLESQVILQGARPNEAIMQAYRQSDIFALASVVAPNGDRDGIPVVMMEAGAHGLPLVSTQVSGIPELAQNEKTGLIVAPADAAALADALERLLNDPTLRRQLGEAAKALVYAEYGIVLNAQRLYELFAHIIAAEDAHKNSF